MRAGEQLHEQPVEALGEQVPEQAVLLRAVRRVAVAVRVRAHVLRLRAGRPAPGVLALAAGRRVGAGVAVGRALGVRLARLAGGLRRRPLGRVQDVADEEQSVVHGGAVLARQRLLLVGARKRGRYVTCRDVDSRERVPTLSRRRFR